MGVGSSFDLRIMGFSGSSRCIPMAAASPPFSPYPASGRASLTGVLGGARTVTKTMKAIDGLGRTAAQLGDFSFASAMRRVSVRLAVFDARLDVRVGRLD